MVDRYFIVWHTNLDHVISVIATLDNDAKYLPFCHAATLAGGYLILWPVFVLSK